MIIDLSRGFYGIKAVLQPIVFSIGASKEESEKLKEKFMEELKSVYSTEELLEPIVVTSEYEARLLPFNIDRKVDAIILWAHGRRYIYRRLSWLKIPVIIWDERGYCHAASWDIRGFLKHWGVRVITPIGPEEHKRVVKVISAVNAFKASKLIVFGRIPAPNVASQWCLEEIERKLGLVTENISVDYLLEKAERIDAERLEKTLAEWRDLFINFNREALEGVAKLYLAIKDILEERKANAFTINCLEDLFSKKFIPPCIALAKFIDEGIVAGCEADINVALSMMILSFISRSPVLMGNIYLFRPWPGPGFPPSETKIKDIEESLKTNVVRLTHDVIPLTMGVKSKWALEDYHNMGKGATAYVPLKTNSDVTLLRISPDLSEMIAIKGKILKVEDTIHCRFSAWIKVRNVREIADNAYTFHHAMVYGDYTRELKLFSELTGIELKVL
ncbi:MAG: hypothetical protein DRJ52_04530 [Thermoprotei archaeon]|nr:MAG: hypothetical protein DRJ52_04530 [Thermoprotei archaeon]